MDRQAKGKSRLKGGCSQDWLPHSLSSYLVETTLGVSGHSRGRASRGRYRQFVADTGEFGLEDLAYHVGEGGEDGRGPGIELAGGGGVFGFGQCDVDGPAVRDVVAVGGVGIGTARQLEFDFVEAEIAVRAVQHFPALVRGDGGGEIIGESRELKLGVEAAAEGAGEDHAAGRIEFGVPEVLDADPGAKAEENDDGTGKLLLRNAGEQRESGADAAEPIDEEHDAPGGQAAGEEFVVDVSAIGPKDGLMAEETADDGESGIEEGNGEGQEGGSHAEDGGGFRTPEQPIAAEEETDEEAASIAQKDGGGTEVVSQEAEEGGSEGGGGILWGRRAAIRGVGVAKNPTPAGRPSPPSMGLNALGQPTSHRMVTGR